MPPKKRNLNPEKTIIQPRQVVRPVQPVRTGISSNHLPAFIAQSLIVATIVLIASVLVFSFIYDKTNKPVLTAKKSSNGPVTEGQLADKPVDESIFNEAPVSIDPSKLENLFPEIK